MSSRILAVCVAVSLAGCSSSPAVLTPEAPAEPTKPNKPKLCEANSDCGSKQYCSEGTCLADPTPPALTVATPTAGTLFSTPEIGLNGTVDDFDGSGIESVEYSLDDVSFKAATLAGGKFTTVIALPEVDWTELNLTVRARDKVGHESVVRVPFKLDRLAPRIELTVPDETHYSGNAVGTTLTWAGVIEESGELVESELSIDGGSTWSACDEGGSCVYTLEVPVVDDLQIAFQVRAKDAAGHASAQAAKAAVSLDTKPPSLELTSPAEGTIVASEETLQLTGSVADQHLAEFAAELDGVPLDIAVDQGAFSLAIPIAATDFQQHELVVSAKDASGNRTEVRRSYGVDKLAPLLTISSPANGAVFSTLTPSPITLSGAFSDARLVSASIQIDGGPVQELPLYTGAFNLPFALADEDQTSHSIRLRARDEVGNESSRSITFTVDRKAPEIVIATPTDAQLLGRASSYTATGTTHDAALASATYRFGDGAAKPLTLSGTSFALPLAYAEDDDDLVRELTIVAKDQAGNESLVTRAYRVDRKAPALTLVTPEADAILGAKWGPASAVANLGVNFLWFRGNVSDGGTLTLAGTIGGASAAVTRSGSSWQYSWEPPESEGASFTFALTATDEAGNASSVTRKVWVDRTRPSANILVASKRLVARDSALVEFDEPIDLATLGPNYSLSPAVPSFALASANGRVFRAADPSGLAPYSVYTLRIGTTIQDLAGNPIDSGATGSFLTEPVAPPPGMLAARVFKTPKVSVDADGNPAIAAFDSTQKFTLRTWDGRSAWHEQSIWGGASVSEVFQLHVASKLAADGFHLENRYQVLANSGMSVALVEVAPGQTTRVSQTLLPGSFQYGPGLGFWLLPGTGAAPSVEAAYYNVSAKTAYARVLAAGEESWSTPTTLYALPAGLTEAPHAIKGAGLLRPGTNDSQATAVFVPTGVEVATVAIDPAATSNRALVGLAPWTGSNNLSRNAWLAWATRWHVAPREGTSVQLACSSTPASLGSWKIGAIDGTPALDPFPDGTSSAGVSGLDLAVSADRVALAAANATTGKVSFASFPFTGCGSGPVLTAPWEPAIPNAKDPSVALAPDGRLFKVYLANDTSALMLAP